LFTHLLKDTAHSLYLSVRLTLLPYSSFFSFICRLNGYKIKSLKKYMVNCSIECLTVHIDFLFQNVKNTISDSPSAFGEHCYSREETDTSYDKIRRIVSPLQNKRLQVSVIQVTVLYTTQTNSPV